MSGIVYEFRNNEAARSYVRLSQAATDAWKEVLDAADVIRFTKRVRLPGSAFVARQFGRLEAWKAARVERQAQAAWKAARVERQAQAACDSARSPIRYDFKASGHESVERAFRDIEAATKRGVK